MPTNTIELAVAITYAWLGNANTRASVDDIPAFLSAAHAALAGLDGPTEAPQTQEDHPATYTPAVSVRASLANPDRIVSMLDGKAYSSLTRHLKANGLTPDEYRQRYGLKPGYPMVAPNYSKARSETAKRLGLGRKAGTKANNAPATPTTVEAAKKPRAKLGVAEARAAAKKHLGGS